MKYIQITKAVLIAFITLTFSFCGGDDDSEVEMQVLTSQITATIDGENIVFDTVVIGEYEDNGTTYRSISATVGNSTSRLMTFGVVKNQTGNLPFYTFNYIDNGMSYLEVNTVLNTVVSTHTDSKLTAIFSGQVQLVDGTQNFPSITITNGSVDLNY